MGADFILEVATPDFRMTLLQSFGTLNDRLLLDALQEAIASNCSLREGSGLRAKRPRRLMRR